MYSPVANTSSAAPTLDASSRSPLPARLLALYGVRVRTIGMCFALFGTRITVCSFTPSRIGIMTSRFSKFARSAGLTCAGMSGASGGVGVASARIVESENNNNIAAAVRIAATMRRTACTRTREPMRRLLDRAGDGQRVLHAQRATCTGRGKAVHAKLELARGGDGDGRRARRRGPDRGGRGERVLARRDRAVRGAGAARLEIDRDVRQRHRATGRRGQRERVVLRRIARGGGRPVAAVDRAGAGLGGQ